MSDRNLRVSRALRQPPRWVSYVTVAVIALGVLGVLLLVPRAERRRVRLVERLAPGDDSSRVVHVLGAPPLRCAAGRLVHLERRFPAGWNAAATQQALERLRQTTAQRWVFPLEAGEGSCADGGRATEVGLDAAGRVLWLMALPDRRPLRLPEAMTPATPTGAFAPRAPRRPLGPPEGAPHA